MLSISYRHARKEDLIEVAQLFLAAFPESVQHYTGREVKPDVIADAFAICLDAEAAAFHVAVTDGKVVGYIFAPSRFSHLLYIATVHFHLLRMLGRWISGQYGVGIRPVGIAIQNWLTLLGESRMNDGVEARILSVGVDPRYQGHKIGTNLMNLGLDYLTARKVQRVRLEVRPENLAAKHLYEKCGFRTIGATHDTQGEWLIMVKDLQDDMEA